MGRTKSVNEAVILAVVFAFSYFLIHYSSEARGYAFVPLFC